MTKYSRYLSFTRDEWAKLRAATPLTLSQNDLTALSGINEKVSLEEVTEIYLPLSRLLNLHVAATQNLHQTTATFLGHSSAEKVPYVIGIAGSVAVGKSTTARILQALLARWSNHPQVELITTDGFLYPNRVLEERGLMKRKGFPESYDLRRLVQFMADVKAGRPEVAAPVYSHQFYDIIPGEVQIIRQPDILIVEGLNVLQAGDVRSRKTQVMFVSDFFDFSIYVDADEEHIKEWFVERLLTLRDTVFRDESSYFHRYVHLSVEETKEFGLQVWHQINGVNLEENILPTRERANLILKKASDHSVERVRLCKI